MYKWIKKYYLLLIKKRRRRRKENRRVAYKNVKTHELKESRKNRRLLRGGPSTHGKLSLSSFGKPRGRGAHD
jgi:hypothetical protein